MGTWGPVVGTLSQLCRPTMNRQPKLPCGLTACPGPRAPEAQGLGLGWQAWDGRRCYPSCSACVDAGAGEKAFVP